ncbi:MAG: hypothetical protein WD963_00580 [Candidatus Paceibacterota bacterium]
MSIEENTTASPAGEIKSTGETLATIAKEMAEIDHTLALLILDPLKHGYKKAFKLWTADEVYKMIHASLPFFGRKGGLYNESGDSFSAEKEKAKILTLQKISENLRGVTSSIDQSVLNQIRSIL